MYVNNLATGGNSLKEVNKIKENSVQLLKKEVSIYISETQMCLIWRVKIVTKVN